MGKNWAIAIGINHYYSLQPLKYAKLDAEAMQDWLKRKAGFDQVFLFTEDSKAIAASPQPILTQPTFANVYGFLEKQFEKPLLKPEDNLWFFFAGHGVRYKDQDYLMFLDSAPAAVDRTAISVDYVTQRLRRSGAENVVLFIDACRNEDGRGGLGIGEEEHQGVITFYSCNANQLSWEIDALQHGAFTYALLEGLNLQGEGNCATVERLARYLYQRVPPLNAQYKKQIQNPYFKADPPYKMYFILLKQSATYRDAQPLIDEAQKAELEGDLLLAQRLWKRLWGLPGVDERAFTAIQRIAVKNTSVNQYSGTLPREEQREISQASTPSSTIAEKAQPETHRTVAFSPNAHRLNQPIQKSLFDPKTNIAGKFSYIFTSRVWQKLVIIGSLIFGSLIGGIVISSLAISSFEGQAQREEKFTQSTFVEPTVTPSSVSPLDKDSQANSLPSRSPTPEVSNTSGADSSVSTAPVATEAEVTQETSDNTLSSTPTPQEDENTQPPIPLTLPEREKPPEPSPEEKPEEIEPPAPEAEQPATENNNLSVPAFPVGTTKDTIQAALGEANKVSRGAHGNTRSHLYRQPNKVDLGYIIDRKSGVLRQTEVSFSQSAGKDVMQRTLQGMLGGNMSSDIEQELEKVYQRRKRRHRFQKNGLKGVIERNNQDRIYIAVWDSSLH